MFAPKLAQFPGSVDGVLSQQEAERRADNFGCVAAGRQGVGLDGE
jgi:hypothetical protein